MFLVHRVGCGRTVLLSPKGEDAAWLPWCAWGEGGRTTVRVRSAHNDEPGRWRLRVRETTTGRSGESAVRLLARE